MTSTIFHKSLTGSFSYCFNEKSDEKIWKKLGLLATTDIGNKILMFSTLSFLGLGSAPPTPEWGMMVSDGVDYFNKFWVAGFPGLAIFTMAVGANFIGDGLRDLLDPKLRTQF